MSFAFSDSAAGSVPLSPEAQAALDAFVARCASTTNPGAIVEDAAALPVEAQNVFWSAVQQWGILVTEISCLLAATEWHLPAESREVNPEPVSAEGEQGDE